MLELAARAGSAKGNFPAMAVAFLNCALFGSVSIPATKGVFLGT